MVVTTPVLLNTPNASPGSAERAPLSSNRGVDPAQSLIDQLDISPQARERLQALKTENERILRDFSLQKLAAAQERLKVFRSLGRLGLAGLSDSIDQAFFAARDLYSDLGLSAPAGGKAAFMPRVEIDERSGLAKLVVTQEPQRTDPALDLQA